MIPFFRKIRKKMADDNRPLKYLRYAIGEIILVVLGILIALQINNWNEERKTDKRIDYLLEKVQHELKLNIENSITLIDDYRYLDSLYYHIHHNSLSYDDYYTNKDLAWITNYYSKLTIIDKAYLNLMGIDNGLSKQFDSIVVFLNKVYETDKQEVYNYNDEIKEFITQSNNYLIENKTWYSDYVSGNFNEEIINYFIYDSIHKNKLQHYVDIGLGNHLSQVNIFRFDALRTYRLIRNYLKEERKIESDPILQSNEYKNYVGTYKRGEQVVEVTVENGKVFTLYRSTKTDIGNKREIIPISKWCFIRDRETGFNYFKIGEDNKASEYIFSYRYLRHVYKKLNKPARVQILF